MADTENKRRTITLTDRPPVIISDDKWPLIASASDKEFDNQYEFQANRISKWFVGVRQHEDGRTIVYATYSYSSNWQNSRDYSAKRGVMLDSFALREASDSADIVRAVREVTEDIAGAECQDGDAARWRTLADECIADLPADVLDEDSQVPSAHEAAVKIADTVDIMLQIAQGVAVPSVRDDADKAKWVAMFEAIIDGSEGK